MCTQELIWCSCGHGEFLPVKLCTTGQVVGTCWTIVHGDHNIVLQSRCSYCQAGLSRRKPLRSARPRGGLAERVEGNEDGELGELLRSSEGDDAVGGIEDWDKVLPLVEGDGGMESAGVGVGAQTTTMEMAKGEVVEPLDECVGEFSFDDVVGTDWEKGFDLNDELWTYADAFPLEGLDAPRESQEQYDDDDDDDDDEVRRGAYMG